MEKVPKKVSGTPTKFRPIKLLSLTTAISTSSINTPNPLKQGEKILLKSEKIMQKKKTRNASQSEFMN